MKLDTMSGLKRTDYCGTLTIDKIGETVVVCGWAARQRDLGQLIFIDLRDRTGIVQLAFDDTTDREIFSKAFQVRSEYVLMAKGTVRKRSSVNPDIPTGEIEIEVTELKVLASYIKCEKFSTFCVLNVLKSTFRVGGVDALPANI